jgi:hypothetical protein
MKSQIFISLLASAQNPLVSIQALASHGAVLIFCNSRGKPLAAGEARSRVLLLLACQNF